MAYKVILSKKALESLWEAMDWYENQSPGLGAELMQEFFDHLQKLTENPQQFMTVLTPFRRMLLKRFPYKVVFVIDEIKQKVVVVVLWHTKRNPDTLKQILERKL